MKYYILAGFVGISAMVAVILASNQSSHVAQDDAYAAKRTIVETETKVRPASFEDMKFKLSDEVEMRAPASNKKK